MTIGVCRECGHNVITSAKTCPRCGAQNPCILPLLPGCISMIGAVLIITGFLLFFRPWTEGSVFESPDIKWQKWYCQEHNEPIRLLGFFLSWRTMGLTSAIRRMSAKVAFSLSSVIHQSRSHWERLAYCTRCHWQDINRYLAKLKDWQNQVSRFDSSKIVRQNWPPGLYCPANGWPIDMNNLCGNSNHLDPTSQKIWVIAALRRVCVKFHEMVFVIKIEHAVINNLLSSVGRSEHFDARKKFAILKQL